MSSSFAPRAFTMLLQAPTVARNGHLFPGFARTAGDWRGAPIGAKVLAFAGELAARELVEHG